METLQEQGVEPLDTHNSDDMQMRESVRLCHEESVVVKSPSNPSRRLYYVSKWALRQCPSVSRIAYC